MYINYTYLHEKMYARIICGFLRSHRGTISKTAPYSNKRAALSPAATWRWKNPGRFCGGEIG